tara:strand:+ start:186 stop:485 length:300 start_codon:yes stop_codon:yes gene_type:complete
MSDLTKEQEEAIESLGYIVMGNTVIDSNKAVVMDKPDRDGGFITEVPELEALMSGTAEVETVRARDEKGHYIADDPDTPENEAWTTKVVKKVTSKKKKK